MSEFLNNYQPGHPNYVTAVGIVRDRMILDGIKLAFEKQAMLNRFKWKEHKNLFKKISEPIAVKACEMALARANGDEATFQLQLSSLAALTEIMLGLLTVGAFKEIPKGSFALEFSRLVPEIISKTYFSELCSRDKPYNSTLTPELADSQLQNLIQFMLFIAALFNGRQLANALMVHDNYLETDWHSVFTVAEAA